ncbi:MAG: HAD family phosphatase [Clostridia bacterium]|nr:HAD family phosphatase [Clostridia bacterium]
MKIIGSDYDGTLNHNGIDEAKKQKLALWRSKGNVLALISGRFREDVIDLYNEQQFPCDFLIADNGSVIMKTDGTVVSQTRCDGSLAVPLIKALLGWGCRWAKADTNFCCKVYAKESDREDEADFTLETMPEVPYFNQISTALPDFETAAKVTKLISEHFGTQLNALQNGTCIDIVRADMNKAQGLRILADYLGADYSDIIAVGDNINDSDMIREFRSYAMENGVDQIKALADFITPGVGELIEKELEINF